MPDILFHNKLTNGVNHTKYGLDFSTMNHTLYGCSDEPDGRSGGESDG